MATLTAKGKQGPFIETQNGCVRVGLFELDGETYLRLQQHQEGPDGKLLPNSVHLGPLVDPKSFHTWVGQIEDFLRADGKQGPFIETQNGWVRVGFFALDGETYLRIQEHLNGPDGKPVPNGVHLGPLVDPKSFHTWVGQIQDFMRANGL